ncbi:MULTISPECIES: DUF5677 domain-containing protein [unclassified Bacillus cereus group]|uniref:DUF5677 domain-containing protein n=1 Tax=unclassified Bacillus cereus group TaxID=2750818 RepID=UPI0022E2D6AA|nr:MULTISPECIES: DUF5677 domain-containing protein [unclassified Bacillus cereus group]MDA2146971.1 DUF5677 domain-containing protein [Bacillus cereus group sp. Bc248]MDA2174858.1 DUF5677 domain-containing protein [Bacillus cereus group sp. Bc247]
MEKQLEIEELSKSICFAEKLLMDLCVKDDLNLEQKIILSIYRKLIEQVDGNFVLVDHMLAGPSRVVVRSAFENLLTLKYILLEDTFIKNKALCYYVGYIKSLEKMAKQFKKVPPNDMPSDYPDSILQKTSKILNDSAFKDILNEWNRLYRKNKSKYAPYWYSLFDGPKNIKGLVKIINDPNLYRYYGLLSEETHATQALNGLNSMDLINDDFSLRPIRSAVNIGFHEGAARAFCTAAIQEIIKYMSPELNGEFIKLMDELGLVEKYKDELKIRLNQN